MAYVILESYFHVNCHMLYCVSLAYFVIRTFRQFYNDFITAVNKRYACGECVDEIKKYSENVRQLVD